MVVMMPQKKNEPKKVDVEELINRGARVKEDNIESEKKKQFINLRIPIEMLEAVDQAVEEKVWISRTGWILEAIQEKLKRNNDVSQ